MDEETFERKSDLKETEKKDEKVISTKPAVSEEAVSQGSKVRSIGGREQLSSCLSWPEEEEE